MRMRKTEDRGDRIQNLLKHADDETLLLDLVGFYGMGILEDLA